MSENTAAMSLVFTAEAQVTHAPPEHDTTEEN